MRQTGLTFANMRLVIEFWFDHPEKREKVGANEEWWFFKSILSWVIDFRERECSAKHSKQNRLWRTGGFALGVMCLWERISMATCLSSLELYNWSNCLSKCLPEFLMVSFEASETLHWSHEITGSLAVIPYFRNVFWLTIGFSKLDARLFSVGLLANKMDKSLSSSEAASPWPRFLFFICLLKWRMSYCTVEWAVTWGFQT